jgi:hypothetical protein
MRQFNTFQSGKKSCIQSAPSAARPSGLHTSNTTNRITTGARLSALSAKTQLMKSSNTGSPPLRKFYFALAATQSSTKRARSAIPIFCCLARCWHSRIFCTLSRGIIFSGAVAFIWSETCAEGGNIATSSAATARRCGCILNWLVADKLSRKGARGYNDVSQQRRSARPRSWRRGRPIDVRTDRNRDRPAPSRVAAVWRRVRA